LTETEMIPLPMRDTAPCDDWEDACIASCFVRDLIVRVEIKNV